MLTRTSFGLIFFPYCRQLHCPIHTYKTVLYALFNSTDQPALIAHTVTRREIRYYLDMPLRSLIPVSLLLFMSVAGVYASLIQANDQESMTHITAAELNELIKTGHAPVIVDVRSSREYRAGHVPGAVHLPFWLTFARADDIDAPKDKLVVVYCAHGPRAGIGKAALLLEGFTQVRYLQGHMSGWYKAKLPVEMPPQ
jgi:rhodanese-related sulfurtransferase